MIEHNLLIKTKVGVSTSAINDLINHMKDLESIPGVHMAYIRFNVSEENVTNRYDICLRVQLLSREALKVYLDHPTHRIFADAYVHPIKDHVTVFDLDI